MKLNRTRRILLNTLLLQEIMLRPPLSLIQLTRKAGIGSFFATRFLLELETRGWVDTEQDESYPGRRFYRLNQVGMRESINLLLGDS